MSYRALQIVLLLLSTVCVVISLPAESRVVSGQQANIEKYPFTVSMRSATGSHSCGASIIANKWILTAAHCVVGRRVQDVSIQYGLSDISKNGPNVAQVKNIIIHTAYKPANSYANDIALLELQTALALNNKTIAAVKLPEPNYETPQIAEGTEGTLVGWGLNSTYGLLQDHLQEVQLKIYSDAECNARHNGTTSKDHLCGGVDAGGKGQCSGDSGGPLLYQGNIQLGIVSWSIKPCTVAPYPGVYTKVSHYIDWIKQNVAE